MGSRRTNCPSIRFYQWYASGCQDRRIAGSCALCIVTTYHRSVEAVKKHSFFFVVLQPANSFLKEMNRPSLEIESIFCGNLDSHGLKRLLGQRDKRSAL